MSIIADSVSVPSAPSVVKPPTASESFIESARALGAIIPAADLVPEAFESVFITDGWLWFQGFTDPDGRWWFDARRPCPDGFVRGWVPEPDLTAFAAAHPKPTAP